jgi:phosphoglycolate phosphatase-like HAD superfamily hydrolase
MPARRDSLVGVDSDGCVFDSMEVKQKACFHPLIISHWGLEPIADAVRETAAFCNLYSRWRGTNRFPALLRVFDLLRARRDVALAGVALPELRALRRFVGSGAALSNAALAAAAESDPALADVLAWSEAVNAAIAATVRDVRVFPWARESLALMRERSDVICVSQTPAEALLREWKEQGLDVFVRLIAGQELGTKADQLVLAARGKYAAGRLLMIGDAIGDYEAARAAGALFYPVEPGREEASWRRFHAEAYERFLAGRYAGPYENALVASFLRLLPETPPPGWDAPAPGAPTT